MVGFFFFFSTRTSLASDDSHMLRLAAVQHQPASLCPAFTPQPSQPPPPHSPSPPKGTGSHRSLLDERHSSLHPSAGVFFFSGPSPLVLSGLCRFHGAPPTALPTALPTAPHTHPRGLRGFTAGLVYLPGVCLFVLFFSGYFASSQF